MANLVVIIPVYADDEQLSTLLAWTRAHELDCVVADGASMASTAAQVRASGARYLACAPGRGNQIAAAFGTLAPDSAQWVWVLHADCRPSPQAVAQLRALIAQGEPRWGRFNISMPELPLIAWFMNWRSRLTRICTGDQGMFIHTSLLTRIGGFPAQPLMEDIEVCKRLKRADGNAFAALSETVSASARRWLQAGVVRTVLSMWTFRVRYWLGAAPDTLYQEYYGGAP